jgi:hypothetical protein
MAAHERKKDAPIAHASPVTESDKFSKRESPARATSRVGLCFNQFSEWPPVRQCLWLGASMLRRLTVTVYPSSF